MCVTEGGGCRGDQDFFKGKVLFYSQWKRMCNIESPHSYLEVTYLLPHWWNVYVGVYILGVGGCG